MQPTMHVPHNEQAERAVIGSMLIDPEAITLATDHLSLADFYLKHLGWLFGAIVAVHREQASETGVDLLAVCDKLEEKGRLKDVGGMPALVALVNEVESAIHIEQYAKIVSRDSAKRGMINAASQVAQLAYSNMPIEEAMEESAALLMAMLDKGARGSRVTLAGEAMLRVLDTAQHYAENPIEKGQTRGVDTGFVDLNKAIDGWHPGLHVLYAVTHTGKTWLALHTLMHCCRHVGRGMIFPLEMTAEQLVLRLALADAKLDPTSFKCGLKDEEVSLFVHSSEKVLAADMVIDDGVGTIGQIEASIRREHRRNPLSLVVIDTLGKIRGSTRGDNRHLELADYTSRLKGLTRLLDLPILLVHHAGSKGIATRANPIPQPSDLYESGRIEHDADTLISMFRSEMYPDKVDVKARIIDLFVQKDRIGDGTGSHVEIFFHRKGQMSNVERRSAEPEPLHLGGENGWLERKDIHG